MKPESALIGEAGRIWVVLDPLTDPEIPVVTLRDLGVLREIRKGEQGWEVVITPTYSGCPAMAQIENDVRAALAEHGIEAKVLVQLAPAWTTDWMSDEGKAKLLAYGIAPPGPSSEAGSAQTMFFKPPSPQQPGLSCPRCGSRNTSEISHFGSTPCKSLRRCLDCMEPFDHFKPH